MGLTLSHASALYVIRKMRADGVNLHDVEPVSLTCPSPWTGKRWTSRLFNSTEWPWPAPTSTDHLHVLVPERRGFIHTANVVSHTVWQRLPANSVLFVDKHTSVVCPELLYLQLADTLTLPQLVLFGHELCGHYSYAADDPVHKKAICQIPSATSVENLNSFLSQFTQARGLAKAKEALPYVRDHALSVPETIMSTMYSLPVAESGYQMGPVTLNERIQQDGSDDQKLGKTRYPDLLFPFAPIGINYDGVDHLDLDGIADAAKATVSHDSMTAQTPQDSKDASDDEENELKKDAQTILQETIARVRGKALDDNSRNRELAARGYIVLPATKEDLYSISALDTLTRLILHCAKNIFDIDVAHFEKQLDDTELTRDRANLLASLTKWNSM